MEIDGIKAPVRRGCETQIYLCQNCKQKHECECKEHKSMGWCYTYKEKRIGFEIKGK